MPRFHKYKISFELGEAYQKFTDYLDKNFVKYGQKKLDSPVVIKAEYDSAIFNLLHKFKQENNYDYKYTVKSKVNDEWKEVDLSSFESFASLGAIFDEYFANEDFGYSDEDFGHYEEESPKDPLLTKIDNGEELTEKELSDLVCNYETQRTYSDNRRWTRSVQSIVEIEGRHFFIGWEEGLTEMQENEFSNQPIEVQCREYQKTITVKEWRPLNKEDSFNIDKDDIDEER